ncbi:DMT family transporter [Roseateles sp. DAIF2]|uniref:DMT family transporter n=1 Tax=Roseateles sp. DAIF2 TaxID=2714952 RepID=UPI0018A25590|nr:DMT family transporter [Roseateles sp. DAIF2]QPF71779.1 DMT family transporter [Roseateles sp. DAIF2]
MRSPAPYFALVFNALIWGLSWWPFRQFQAAGLHPLWTTVLLYSVSMLVISLTAGRRAWREFLGTPALWLIMLAAGTTNTAFNWGVAMGDVVRVVLLFYLMPLWAVLLARVILKEHLTPLALARIALALSGAAAVLWPEQGGFPLPASLADWLGVLGGLTFAFNNVMLRREAARSPHARALAMFGGGVLVAGSAALAMAGAGLVPAPALPGWWWLLPVAAMALLFFLSNLALQYGASRLPANVTAIVMLVEVPAAALSALWLGGGALDLKTALGGLAILGAALLAALERRR